MPRSSADALAESLSKSKGARKVELIPRGVNFTPNVSPNPKLSNRRHTYITSARLATHLNELRSFT